MTSRDFCYWLQGFFEIEGVKAITLEQAQMIQKHLSLVFVHEIDPSFGKDNIKLNQIHNVAIENHINKNPSDYPNLDDVMHGKKFRC